MPAQEGAAGDFEQAVQVVAMAAAPEVPGCQPTFEAPGFGWELQARAVLFLDLLDAADEIGEGQLVEAEVLVAGHLAGRFGDREQAVAEQLGADPGEHDLAWPEFFTGGSELYFVAVFDQWPHAAAADLEAAAGQFAFLRGFEQELEGDVLVSAHPFILLRLGAVAGDLPRWAFLEAP